MENKTAVQWLYDKLMDTPKDKFDWYALLEKALKMEQEQYDHAFKYGVELNKKEQNLNNMDKISHNHNTANDGKTAAICCGVLERMQLGWMKLEDGTRCMPYIKGHSDDNMYRVNNCPSCGKYVRDVMVEP